MERALQWLACGQFGKSKGTVPWRLSSDNLTPQETTNQDAPDMGADGAGLSCPGGSMVAEGTSCENATDPETIGSTIDPMIAASDFLTEVAAYSLPFAKARVH